QDLQCEDELGLARYSRVGADEKHPELVVLDFVLQENGLLLARLSSQFLYVIRRGVGMFGTPESSEHLIEGYPIEPRAPVVGQPALWPRLHRAEQRRLHGVFAELHAVHAEAARAQRPDARTRAGNNVPEARAWFLYQPPY